MASELATNLSKYGSGGEIHVSRLSDRGHLGIEILSIDRGPGIEDLERCLSDGYSSSGTSGTGLGAVMRSSTTFDAYSEAGKGTVVLSRLVTKDGVSRRSGLELGAVGKPIVGETASGDTWALREDDTGIYLLVADGLGHGLLAFEASSQAAHAFQSCRERATASILQHVHSALKGTRGAAGAIARIDYAAGRVDFTGVGNISGVIVGGPKNRWMVSHNGTLGFEARRFQEFNYLLQDNSLVVMHSDGITTSWNLEDHPGLSLRHPSIVAAVLYRDAARHRDDMCVVALRRYRDA